MSNGIRSMEGRPRAALFVSALFAVAACAGGPAPGGTVPDAAGAGHIYVTNQGEATVSVVDRATFEEVRRLDLQALGFSENAKPHHVVVEPDGSFWYVSLIGENIVLKMTPDGRIAGRATMEVPGLLALHPTEDVLFAGRSMSAVSPPSSIMVIDRSAMEVVDEVPVLFPRPHALGVRAGGDVAYTASLATNQIAAIDLGSGDVEVVDVPGAAPHTFVEFALSPDQRTMVATSQLSGKLLVFDLSEPMRPRHTRTVDVGAWPWDVVWSPDGSTVWVPNKQDDTVMAVDAGTWTVTDTIRGQGLAQPDGAVLSPDGRLLYVTNNNLSDVHGHMGGAEHRGTAGTLVVIDTATRGIVEVVPVGANPTGIGTRSGR